MNIGSSNYCHAAFTVAYVGTGYQGFQKQPGGITVEGELESAMSRAGILAPQTAMTEGGRDQARWSRAARTDKGVSAAANVVACSVIQGQDHIQRINESLLSSQIRVLGVKFGLPEGFDARRSCTGRRYEYLLPLWALDPLVGVPRSGASNQLSLERNVPGGIHVSEGVESEACLPSDGGDGGSSQAMTVGGKRGRRWAKQRDAKRARMNAKSVPGNDSALRHAGWMPGESERKATASATQEALSSQYDLNEERLEKLNSILALFEGCHSFHNFTKEVVTPDSSEACRTVERFVCNGVIEVEHAPPPDTGSAEGLSGPQLPLRRRYARLVIQGRSFMMHQIRKMVGLAMAVSRGVADVESIAKALSPTNIRLAPPMVPGTGLLMDRAFYEGEPYKVDPDVLVREDSDAFKLKSIYPSIAAADPAEMWLFLKGLNEAAFRFSKWPNPNSQSGLQA